MLDPIGIKVLQLHLVVLQEGRPGYIKDGSERRAMFESTQHDRTIQMKQSYLLSPKSYEGRSYDQNIKDYTEA